MDVTLTDEQVEVRDSARKLLAAESPPADVRAMAGDPRGYSETLWKKMAELGWLGLAVPDEHGGLGQSFMDLCLLVEEQGRALLPGPFLSTVVLGAQAIARFGSEAHKAAHLPAICDGDRIIAIAQGAWEPGDVGIEATRDQSGYLLDGLAPAVDHAHVADLLLVVARHKDRLSAFLVPSEASGMTSTRLEVVDRGHCYRVEFGQVHLPENAVLGRPGAGEEVARALAMWGAAARCAEMIGIGQQVLDMTAAFARDRIAFGSPIGAFQAVQHHCANMAVDVLSSIGVTREAVWRVSVDDGRAAEAVSIAKAWVSDAIARVCALGHQVHGAIGFTAEHHLHLYVRRARAAELAFGDGAWHRGRVAAMLGI